MGTHALDLGELYLASTETDLRLELSSSAHFASSEKDIGLLDQLTIPALTSQAATRPWATRASGYRLVLRFHFPDDLDAFGTKNILGSLSTSLSDKVWWKQFCMKSTSIHIQKSADSDTSELVLHLDYDDDAYADLHQQHKLSLGVPVRDIHLPPGVPVVKVDHILLDARFVQGNGQKRRRLDPFHSESGTTRDLSESKPLKEDDCNDGQELLEGIDKCCHGSCHLLYNISEFLPSRTVPPSSDLLRPEPMLVSQITPIKRCLDTVDVQNDRYAAHSAAILKLVDACIRCAISSASRNFLRGVRLLSNLSLKPLADVLPALWQPGYIEFISSRSVMLPTIAHVSHQACGEKARSASLGSKIAELLRRADRCSLNSPTTNHERVKQSDSMHLLTRILWSIVQRSSCVSDANCRFKPLAMQSSNPAIECEMLFDRGEEGSRRNLNEAEPDNSNLSSDNELLHLEPATLKMPINSLPCAHRVAHGSSQPTDIIFSLMSNRRYSLDSQAGPGEDDMLSICETVDSMELTGAPEVEEESQRTVKDMACGVWWMTDLSQPGQDLDCGSDEMLPV